MDHKITHLSSVEKELTITFTVEEVAEQLGTAFKRLSATAQVKGFRPGKVPMQVIKQFYGKSVKEDAEQYFIGTGIQDAITKEKLRLIRYPLVSHKGEAAEGKEFSFTFRVEIFPDIAVAPKEYSIEFVPAEFKEEMLTEELNGFRRRHTKFTAVERPAKNGDRVTVNFTGTIGGVAVDGVTGNAVPVILGEKNFLPAFEEALMGRKAGEKLNTPITFPENYHSKELAGKTVDFAIEVTATEESHTPELTDEFMAEKGDGVKTVAEFTQKTRERIENYLDDINRENKRYLLVDRYVHDHDFEVPRSFLESEIAAREADHRKQHPDTEMTAEEKEKLRADATWVAKRFILISQLANDLKVEVTEEKLDAELQKEAARYNIPLEYYKRYFNEEKLEEKKLALREQLVIDRLMEKAAFVKKAADPK
ncbi:MAG TPA: trigger factor [bacterium]|nr:trigger factor [bacterium]